MTKMAVFASGNGSNFQAIIDGCRNHSIPGSVELLVCDQPEAFAVERAREYGIPTFVFRAKNYSSKKAFEEEILRELGNRDIKWILLAGYMRLIGETLLCSYPKRIVNIHPSLLPYFPGKDAIAQALEASANETGVTVHYVDEGMDTGPIISQRSVDILPGETVTSLQKKIQQVEHELYPSVVKALLEQTDERSR
ncbi:phosphoribosylglycinamide formyltransferase [Bacillus coahuilensis m2-6]|uniref:phosphoribosylglycinamide formyltransferase n=1 Tax=Bacillus coahuilensis TaxID=408580 RepID=UPI00075006BD|nr:phosphoribosylglycinamide formyltransferase [Bacillus coahuilensis]KUP09953.1 phosphoribosylglycinamide formyltransferase [Bacillus coahuilensis m2-6]